MNMNTIEIDGKEYTLTLNRKAVKVAESVGLTPEALFNRPINSIDLLWRASFLPNHPEINDEKALELYEKLEKEHPEKVREILKSLTEQYSAFFKPLSDTD